MLRESNVPRQGWPGRGSIVEQWSSLFTMTRSQTKPAMTAPAVSAEQPTWKTWGAAALLALVWIVGIPLFLAQPLTDDTHLYDLQARTALNGGVLYRDILEPNLPGVIWLHLLIRSVGGWSSTAMRTADLLIYTGIVWLLILTLRPLRLPRWGELHTAALLYLCYFSISEWNHCQRDFWFLLPALAAWQLRRWRFESVGTVRSALAWGFLEGVIWAIGFWIKPHIFVLGLACWLYWAALHRQWRLLLADALGMLLGGGLVGLAGIGWLQATGTWPHLLTMLQDWNPRYFAARLDHWTRLRYLAMTARLFPWVLLHLVAVTLGVRMLRAGWRSGNTSPAQAGGLLAVCYFAWLLQVYALQHLFDYVHAPGLLLALVVTVWGIQTQSARPALWKWAAVPFLALCLWMSPLTDWNRVSLWSRCVTETPSPDLQNRLTSLNTPDWEALDRVAVFLDGEEVQGQELLCMNNNLISLYNRLETESPTRFAFVESYLAYVPEKQPEIWRELRQSPARYVVCDLVACGVNRQTALAVAPGGEPANPPGMPEVMQKKFPWNQPVVYRDGQLVVYRVQTPPRQLVSAPAAPSR